MSDIAILKEMINPLATVPLKTYYKTKQVVLQEDNTTNPYSVTISGMPDDDQTIVIKGDAFKAPKDIFADSRNECKRADFIIVAETDKKKVIICIEMKEKKGKTEKDIIKQLKGAKCFVTYCREIGQSFWDHPNFLKDKDYAYRFVSIRNIGIAKKPTHYPYNQPIHDSPEKMLKINSYKGIQFNHLLGKL
jgi:hypothetical protein